MTELWVRDGEEFEVMNDFAVGLAHADGRELLTVRGGGGDPDLVVPDDGGGPSFAGNGYGPFHVFGGAPFEREAGGGGVAVTGGAAELRPLVLGGRGVEGEQNGREEECQIFHFGAKT